MGVKWVGIKCVLLDDLARAKRTRLTEGERRMLDGELNACVVLSHPSFE